MIYQPSDDSYLLEEQVKKYSRNKRVLDIGAGSGIQSLSAIKAKAKSVLAIDIDKETLRELKKMKNKYLTVIKSDLFSNIPKKEKFDLIIFNPPYLPKDKREPKSSRLATTGGKKGDEIILKFLKQVQKHMEEDSKILLLVSSLTPRERINKLLRSLEMKFKVLSKKKLFMETLKVLEISKSKSVE